MMINLSALVNGEIEEWTLMDVQKLYQEAFKKDEKLAMQLVLAELDRRGDDK